ncbi:MAG: InlB B-repeat-containing protein [Muribaculaceae bacterium]|nr:InlB B-repeat-containing protein [Muribaculaceae bacterium]
MSLYFSMSSAELENTDVYEFGAFVNDECRGVAEKLEMPEGASCLYMRIRSNSAAGEELGFLMRDRKSGETVVLKAADGEPFMFKADEMVGMPSAPFALKRYFNVSVSAGEHGTIEFEDGLFAEGTELHAVAVPDEGYRFEAWSDGSEEAEINFTVSGDMELTAAFAVNTYKAVFMIGEEEIATVEVDFGAAVSAPVAPEREGYTFAGWADLPETMPAQDIVINGSYTINSYLLTVFLNNEIYMEKELEFGAEITIPDPELPEQYEFNGWKEDIPATMPAHDVVIHGTFTDINSVADVVSDADSSVTVYTLGGVLLYKDVKSAEAVTTPGVYIVNGKKVAVK